MINEEEAMQFARDWVEAWNEHDLERIMAHYAEDVEFTSPFVARLLNEPSGFIKGKDLLSSYFRKGLSAYPDLRFELLDVLVGVSSVTLYYRSVGNRLSAEVMQLTDDRKVSKVMAHYSR